MIHGRSVPNSHPVAPSAKLKSRREPPFITGHHHTKCFAPIVVIYLTVSFSLRWLMKKSTPAKEIQMPGKLKEGGLPFFGRGGRMNSPVCEALINGNFC